MAKLRKLHGKLLNFPYEFQSITVKRDLKSTIKFRLVGNCHLRRVSVKEFLKQSKPEMRETRNTDLLQLVCFWHTAVVDSDSWHSTF